jgi:hypothetical protein
MAACIDTSSDYMTGPHYRSPMYSIVIASGVSLRDRCSIFVLRPGVPPRIAYLKKKNGYMKWENDQLKNQVKELSERVDAAAVASYDGSLSGLRTDRIGSDRVGLDRIFVLAPFFPAVPRSS